MKKITLPLHLHYELQGHISTLVADFKDFRKQEAEGGGGVLGNSIPWVHTKDLLLSPSQNAGCAAHTHNIMCARCLGSFGLVEPISNREQLVCESHFL